MKEETRTQGGTTLATVGCPLRFIEEPVELSIEVGSITPNDELNNCRDLVSDDPIHRADLPAGEMEDDPEADPHGYLYFTKHWNNECRDKCLEEKNILRYISCSNLLEYYPLCKKLYIDHKYEMVFSSVARQTSLECLDIKHCSITSLAGIEFLTNLKKLSLWFCCTIEPLADLFLLSDLPIEKLSIAGTSIAPDTFLDLPRLRSVVISDKIGDTSSGHIEILTAAESRLPMLRKIHVWVSKLEDYISNEYTGGLLISLREKHAGAIIKFRY